MKKFFLITVLFLSIITANAQYYIGGSLGLNGSSGRNSEGKKVGVSNFNFSISPEIGQNISEKWDLGISLNFLTNSRKSFQRPDDMTSKTNSLGIGLSPYVRYSFYKIGNFNVLGKLALNCFGNTIKSFDAEGKENDKQSSTNLGLNLSPLLFYNLTDCISIYTQLNFMGLDYTYAMSKRDGKKTGSSSSFNIGGNTDNLATFDQVRLGFVYKF